ncbi:MAG: CHY zinc finger protein [Firmicutes bacterium]|nr:CHY zinc finger protein [Bacillota bacterium]
MRRVGNTEVWGIDVDEQTRCAHYHTAMDVIAMRFICCDRYFPCYLCHEEVADHRAEVWPRDRFDEPAVLCGACGHRLSARAYLASASRCPRCDAQFNPGCKSHAHLYFEMRPSG